MKPKSMRKMNIFAVLWFKAEHKAVTKVISAESTAELKQTWQSRRTYA